MKPKFKLFFLSFNKTRITISRSLNIKIFILATRKQCHFVIRTSEGYKGKKNPNLQFSNQGQTSSYRVRLHVTNYFLCCFAQNMESTRIKITSNSGGHSLIKSDCKPRKHRKICTPVSNLLNVQTQVETEN